MLARPLRHTDPPVRGEHRPPAVRAAAAGRHPRPSRPPDRAGLPDHRVRQTPAAGAVHRPVPHRALAGGLRAAQRHADQDRPREALRALRHGPQREPEGGQAGGSLSPVDAQRAGQESAGQHGHRPVQGGERDQSGRQEEGEGEVEGCHGRQLSRDQGAGAPQDSAEAQDHRG